MYSCCQLDLAVTSPSGSSQFDRGVVATDDNAAAPPGTPAGDSATAAVDEQHSQFDRSLVATDDNSVAPAGTSAGATATSAAANETRMPQTQVGTYIVGVFNLYD